MGYSTYVKHRLTGFEGSSEGRTRTDWADFPQASARFGGSATVARPACIGPIDWKDKAALQHDIAIPYAAQPEPEEIRDPGTMSAMYAYRRLFKPTALISGSTSTTISL